MDLRPNEQQMMLKDSAARFFREKYAFDRRKLLIAADAPADPGLWSTLVELGWPGSWLPEAVGGLGGSEVDLAVLMDEMGRSLYLGPFLSTCLSAAILRRAPDAAAQDLLASSISGAKRVVLAHGEPGGRGLLDQPAMRAVAEAETHCLSGRKRLVHAARFADEIIVSACADGELAFYAVGTDQPGVVMRHYRTVDNDWASDLEFDRTPARRVVGPADAKAALDDAIYVALLALGAEALGLTEAAFAQTHDYVRTRKQFGRALASFQVVQHRLADLFVEIQQLRASLLDALAHASACPVARRSAAMALKVQAGTIASSVAGQCLHLHGGMGMTDEMPISHYYRRARILEAQFGNSDYYLAAYARLMS